MPTLTKGEKQTGYETSNIPMVVWKNPSTPKSARPSSNTCTQPENYVPFLLSVPVGMLPALKEISQNEEFLADPTVQKFSDSMAVIADAVGYGTAIGMECLPDPKLVLSPARVSLRECSRTSL